jgi:hypothetical protein
VSTDWRLAIAYNAGLQAATTAPAAAGYRASRDNHHYHVIQSLELTLGKEAKFIRTLDAFRKKRIVSNYDIARGISDREVQDHDRYCRIFVRTNHAAQL